MQRQVIVNGRTEYVDCGPSRARSRSTQTAAPTSQSGYREADFIFQHPAAMVRKEPGDKVSR